jgi:hypothetical protein
MGVVSSCGVWIQKFPLICTEFADKRSLVNGFFLGCKCAGNPDIYIWADSLFDRKYKCAIQQYPHATDVGANLQF